MIEKVFYSDKPEAIKYMKLKNGIADVWLRKNIHQTADPENEHPWTADEVYLRTSRTEDEIKNDFDEFFKGTEDSEIINSENTPEERIRILENALAALKLELKNR